MAKKKKLSDAEISAFCEQLGFMIKAGISLQEGLMLLSADTKDDHGKELTDQLLDTVEMGGTLAYALKESGEFPSYMINMVEIGETSGRLDQVLESLRTYYERNEAISRNIRSAVTYPLVMIAMMVAVILIIIVEVMPVFQGVFQQLGSEVPPFVQGVMNFGENVSQYSAVIIIVVAAIIVLFFVLRGTSKGRDFMSGISEKLFKKTSSTIASGRFASAMALMLGSGMDVDSALDMTMEVVESNSIKAKIAEIKKHTDEGEGFAESIVKTGMFSSLYGKMIMVGFKTGSLDSVMERIAHHYEEDTNRRINSLVAAIEPTLVAVMSLVVGMILLSVMLPLMGIMSAIG